MVEGVEVGKELTDDFVDGEGGGAQHLQYAAGALIVEGQPLADEGAVVADGWTVARQRQPARYSRYLETAS